jgi:hypothetical protein
MCSEEFQQILEQLNATGKMKADGYDLLLFKKLDAEELHKAEDLLIEAIYQGDWNGIDALIEIGSSKSIETLEVVFPKINKNRFLKFKVAHYLFDATRKKYYADFITPHLEEYEDTDKISVIRYMPKLKNPKNYTALLLGTAQHDNNKIVRFYSGIYLLIIYGFLNDENSVEDYRP